MDFRIIKDFPNYAILEVGEVKNLKTGRILKSNPDMYLIVATAKENRLTALDGCTRKITKKK